MVTERFEGTREVIERYTPRDSDLRAWPFGRKTRSSDTTDQSTSDIPPVNISALERAARLSSQTLSVYFKDIAESRRSLPSLLTIAKISRVIGCPQGELFQAFCADMGYQYCEGRTPGEWRIIEVLTQLNPENLERTLRYVRRLRSAQQRG
jgi:hypothetical protein